MPRRISETLDADDATIVRMKQERRTDKEIADALVEAGGTKYSYKTIGTRWRRLRTVLATARDRKLDQGIIEWSTDDVSHLNMFQKLLTLDRTPHYLELSKLPTKTSQE